jgi:CheY-like chemotaxis protein
MSTHSPVVLIVEDSRVQAQMLGMTLEEHGVTVQYATDGMIGINLAENLQPAAIIMDWEMPHMNGLAACQQLKANPRTAHIPVIMLTAHSQMPLFEQSMIEGAVDFIPKDAFALAVVLETLRQLRIITDGAPAKSTES